MPKRDRLENLVSRQADVPLEKARAMIRAGQVYSMQGQMLDKPAVEFDAGSTFDVRFSPRYVSRGGDKLKAALKGFALDVIGAVAIDVGASTGGFTDCLLQHGARKVYAIDVGYGQFAWKLRTDPRVTLFERTNIRNLQPASLIEKPDFFAIDCSFISLSAVFAALIPLLADTATGVALIKPQFEAAKDQVEEGGVVRDPRIHEAVIEKVLESARQVGFTVIGVIPSPLMGPAGNREFLASLRFERHA